MMASSRLVLVALVSLLSAVAFELPLKHQRRSYDGWKVIRIFTADSDLEDFLKILLEQEEVSVWGMKRLPDSEIQVDALVGPRFSVDLVVTFMTHRASDNKESNLIHWYTVIDDVEAALHEGKASVRSSLSTKLDWNNYHRFEVIEDYLINTVANRRRTVTVKVGTSIEGRAIYAVVIGNRSKKVASLISAYVERAAKERPLEEGDDQVTTLGPIDGYQGFEVKRGDSVGPIDGYQGFEVKRGDSVGNVIFMEAGIHAREWITIAFATYMIDQLTAEDKAFLDLGTFVIMPLANPDGYVFSHTTDRFWRKNRRAAPQTTNSYICSGVDLNRNFARHFGGKGTSGDACSEIFRGDSSFSEPETQAIRNVFLSLSSHVKFYMAIHSFGQMILYPWGDTLEPSPHEAVLNEIGTSIAESISRFNASNYKVGQSSIVYTYASGASDDYFHSQGVKLAYTMELPGYNAGFLLPPERILPVSKETYCSLRCVAYRVAGKIKEATKCWESCGVKH